mgnify:CR=1 FL=1
MTFDKAYEKMKQGYKIKLPTWDGYWEWENNSIKMNLGGNIIIDIRQTNDIDIIFRFIIRSDWELVS